MSKEKNEAFAKLSAEEKRVAIAKDVFGFIAARKIVATPGVYFAAELPGGLAESSQACKLVAAVESCQVCALGAVFMAAVDNANEVTLSDLGFEDGQFEVEFDYFAMRDYLRRFFGSEQLLVIETAFEGRDVHMSLDGDKASAAMGMFQWNTCDKEICKAYDHDECSSTPAIYRMEAIMRNIIANNGEFIPSPVRS